MLYLAIDLHAKHWTIDLGDEDGKLVAHRQVSTQPGALEKFLTDLAQQAAPHQGFMAVLEVCGFHDYAVELLRRHGCVDVVVVQARQKSRRKTDRRDARQLRELLWLNRFTLQGGGRVPGLRRVRTPSPAEAGSRQLTSLRKKLTERRTQTVNKIHGLLKKHNRQHEMPTKGLQTKKTRQWLAGLELPEIDRLEMDLLLKQWTLWDEQLDAIETRIKQRQAQDENAGLLSSIPGLSAFGSLAVSSRVGNVADFDNGGSLANYFGVTPSCNHSGQTQRSGSITKEGSSMVRYILGQAVLHVLKKDTWMRQWYRDIKSRRGGMIARVAVMRRLATIVWSILKHRLPYVTGGPEAWRRQLTLQRELEQASRPAENAMAT